MPDFFFKLHPPRASFPGDITAEEQAVIAEHVAYWEAELGRSVLTFGPVMAPDGVFGMGVVSLPDEAAAQSCAAQDPVISSGRGFRYDVFPMQAARPPRAGNI
jgi:hypothetical protein